MYRAIKERLPDAVYHAPARAVTLDRSKEPRRPGVAVCCAGTSDVPVAEEAAVTAELMGSVVDRNRGLTLDRHGASRVSRLLLRRKRRHAPRRHYRLRRVRRRSAR